MRLREIKKPGPNPARDKSTHSLCGSLCVTAAKGMMMGSGGSPTYRYGESERTAFFRWPSSNGPRRLGSSSPGSSRLMPTDRSSGA